MKTPENMKNEYNRRDFLNGKMGVLPEDTPLLSAKDLTIQFGGVVAVNDVSLDINKGEIVALIGPNGAGKTTFFNMITGVYEPTNGEIYYQNELMIRNHPRGDMKKNYLGENAYKYLGASLSLTPDKIAAKGIVRTFQNIRLWKSQSVFNNVLIAMHMRRTSNLFSAVFHLNGREESKHRKEVLELLEIVGLDDLKDELAVSLPYGKQRKLEIARALATHPELLLLDEPAAGMNPQETEELAEFIHDLRDRFKLTIFLIEHHMNLVMNISDRIYVMEFGKLIATGTADEIQHNQKVIDAYLGVTDA